MMNQKPFATLEPQAVLPLGILLIGCGLFLSRAKADPPRILVNDFAMTFVQMPNQEIGFGVHEINRQIFSLFAKETGLKNGSWQSPITPAGITQGDDHPVVNVSWEEASRFCLWLSKKENRIYRLPTDYEWSLASGISAEIGYLSPAERARESSRTFFWGDQWSQVRANGNFADQSHITISGKTDCFPFNDGFPATAPVGSFSPNELGLHDMEGNVSEWVYDWYLGRDEYKTVRGASFATGSRNQDEHCKGFRAKFAPDFRSESIGFRVVVELSEEFPMNELIPESKMSHVPAAPFPNAAPEVELASLSTAIPNRAMEEPFGYVDDTGQPDLPQPPPEVFAVERPATGGEDPVARKKIWVNYTGKDGVNLRESHAFSSGNILASLHPQSEIPIEQLSPETKLDTTTWIEVEVKGWIPSKVGSNTFMKDQGDGTWRVTWSKPGDRYVAMRTGPSSDDPLVSKVNYNTVVEQIDTRTMGNRHYIYARFKGWAVQANRKRTYFSNIE